MSTAASPSQELRVLTVAPFGRDAQLAVETLERVGISACALPSVDALIGEIDRGVGAILIAGEALGPAAMKSLACCIATQPPWSDIPIIILTSEVNTQVRGSQVLPAFEEIGNVTFLPRPFSVRTLVVIVRFALRSRSRQYCARELLVQLDEKTRDLSRSNTEFQAFAFTAAHDMREPIRMIESYLSLVTERFSEGLGTTGARYVSTASAAAGRMRTLVQALLEYAHVGNSAVIANPVSLKAVAVAAIRNLSTAIASCSGQVELPSTDLVVLGDEALLIQLIQNLVGNGLKFQRPGAKPNVSVTWSEDGGQWSCAVKDNGIGIPAHARERIFAIFQRLHGMSEYPGSGIGLATCRRIVDRHAGRIWVDSEIGNGSTFYISIPMKQASRMPTEATIAAGA